MLKHIFLVLALSVSLALVGRSASAQARIVTVTGGIYVGTILSEDSKAVVLLTTDSLDITIPREKIESLSYGRVQRNMTGATAPSDIPDQNTIRYYPPQPILARVDEPHWSFGASLGTPAGIQPVIGYHSGEWGVRASAMIVPDATAGLQAGIMKRITSTGHLDLNLMLISGVSMIHERYPRYSEYMWMYAGPALSLDIFGLFAEGGLTLGIGDFSNPQLTAQLGYAYHFK